ncbi:MAG: hypothetical protein J1F31_05985 [Erysipelotrichales bacterium]|nr:hypothetical protein [Erysipelotrichales bacterium]
MMLDIYFENLHITNLVELGQNMYLYPDLAYSLLINNDFIERLKDEEPQIYKKFCELQEIEDDDEFVFKASYLFCPYMSLRYRGYCFDSLSLLGEKMIHFGPNIDVYLMDLLEKHLISYVAELQGLNTVSKEDYVAIKKAERTFIKNPKKAYFTLAFELSKSTVLVYYDRAYINPKTFLEIMTCDANITKFAIELSENEYFFAWLEYLKYENHLKRYKNLVQFIEERENK